MTILDIATRAVVTVAPGDHLDKALALMEEFDIRHLPVAGGRGLAGMLSDRDLLLAVGWQHSSRRRGADPRGALVGPERVEQVMSRPVVTLGPDERLRAALGLMLDRQISAVPVVRERRLLGIVTEIDLLRAARGAPALRAGVDRLVDQPVQDLMTAQVARVSPRASLMQVLELFRLRRVHHVPVVLNGELLGLISDRDVRRALGRAALAEMEADRRGEFRVEAPTALDCMTRWVTTIGPADAVGTGVDRMLEYGVHCLPVLRDGKLIGILTHTDVLRGLVRAEPV